MEDVAGIAGSRRAEPYAFMYAILPSRTTAIEALGAPVRARTSRAALSMVACIGGGRVACAGARVAAVVTASRARQMWKLRRRAVGIGSPCMYRLHGAVRQHTVWGPGRQTLSMRTTRTSF